MTESILAQRKQKHLDICLDRTCNVETGHTEIDRIRLPHASMPEINANNINLKIDFLGYSIRLPLLISCMTGGTIEGCNLNRTMAQAAQDFGIPVGTGSIRIMLREPDKYTHFALKKIAPDVPLLANIGAAQLMEYPPMVISEAVKKIQADALFVHLNAAQEFFQDKDSWNFSGWLDSISRLIESADFPIFIKETGCGISPKESLQLLQRGAQFVDFAGMGGTDWIAVEATADTPKKKLAAKSFFSWGYPTGILMLAYRLLARSNKQANSLLSGRMIASGGLRSPLDFAIAFACGAHMVATALPFLRTIHEGGEEGVHTYLETIEIGLQAAIALSGAGTMEAFRKIPLYAPQDMLDRAIKLAKDALVVLK